MAPGATDLARLNANIQVQAVPDDLFRLAQRLIYEHSRVHLSDSKRTMVAARISKRMRALKMTSYQQYYDHISEEAGFAQERESLIDALTTHLTSFFREAPHFDFLCDRIIPQLLNKPGGNPINIWSCACSTGEEPYTIAMVLAERFPNMRGRFRILATDVSVDVVRTARRAVYKAEAVEGLPAPYKYKYLMRGKGPQRGRYRVVPELRRMVTFGRLNLLAENYGIEEMMDVIFCRNVVIYFDNPTKVILIQKLHEQLVPRGHLVMGHSETLRGINDRFKPVGPTIYQRIK